MQASTSCHCICTRTPRASALPRGSRHQYTPRAPVCHTRCPQHVFRQVACDAFLGNIFGGAGKSNDSASPVEEAAALVAGGDLGEENAELVLVESTFVDGNKARIVYRNDTQVTASEVEDLCSKVGWPARPLKSVETALRNSYLIGSLHIQVQLANGDTTEALIGVGRATSDHVFNATIWDVMVDPQYQGQGLGKALVQEMVRTLLRRKISNITLFADSPAVDFYRQLGFETDLSSIKGMFWYPRR